MYRLGDGKHKEEKGRGTKRRVRKEEERLEVARVESGKGGKAVTSKNRGGSERNGGEQRERKVAVMKS